MKDIIIDGKEYFLDISDIEVIGQFTDYGIGHYEYWGASGYDVDIQPELTDVTINYATDENNQIVSDPNIIQKLIDFILSDNDWRERLTQKFVDQSRDYSDAA